MSEYKCERCGFQMKAIDGEDYDKGYEDGCIDSIGEDCEKALLKQAEEIGEWMKHNYIRDCEYESFDKHFRKKWGYSDAP